MPTGQSKPENGVLFDKSPQTAEVYPVIDFIYDELEARGWNMWQLALRMGGDAQKNKLALELLEASPVLLLGEMAEQLGRAFGTSTAFWENLEASWRAWHKLTGHPDYQQLTGLEGKE